MAQPGKLVVTQGLQSRQPFEPAGLVGSTLSRRDAARFRDWVARLRFTHDGLRREKSSAPAGVSLDRIAAVNPGESLLGLPAEGMELNCSGSEVSVRRIGKLPFGTLPFREAAKRRIADLVTRQVECRQWPTLRHSAVTHDRQLLDPKASALFRHQKHGFNISADASRRVQTDLPNASRPSHSG